MSAEKAGYALSVEPTPIESLNGSNRQLLAKQDEANRTTESASPVEPTPPPPRRSRRKLWLAIGAAAIVILVLIVVLPVYFTVIKKRNGGSGGHGSGGSNGSDGDLPIAQPNGAITGGDGSTVYTDGGKSFTYSNKFGGYWYYDPANPLANSKCQRKLSPFRLSLDTVAVSTRLLPTSSVSISR